MDEMMDRLHEILENRVHDLMEQSKAEEKAMDYPREIANVRRADRIMGQLSEEQRVWLDNLLLSSSMLVEAEARRIYIAGIQDAFRMMKLLEF